MYTQDGDSKYVANILSNMANGGDSAIQVTTYAVPAAAYASGISTGTTSSLTPTTLSNIEQTFIELQSVQANNSATVQHPITQSGFMPPAIQSVVSSDPEQYYSDSSDSDSNWSSTGPKRVKIGDKTTTIMSQYEIENPKRKTHRRQLKNEMVSPEEAARRSLRRERNKVAAAKCRQRRVDHTNRLMNETDKLDKEQQGLENEIQSLQQEKDQLEFILQAHSPLCKAVTSSTSNQKIKEEPRGKVSAPCSVASKKDLSSSVRPSTLPLVKMEAKPTDYSSASVSLTTPSSGFYSFSLDTMVDHTGLTPLTGALGHTGLTPITNGPTSCSNEVKKSSHTSESSDSIRSPTSLISL